MLCVHHLFLHASALIGCCGTLLRHRHRDPTATLPATGELHLPVLAATLLWLGELPQSILVPALTSPLVVESGQSLQCGREALAKATVAAENEGWEALSNMIQPEATWIKA